jgi:glycosyltransferase involved in cell wall biosynthesis
VSYWNLHERPLSRAGDVLHAAGRPLRLLRFHGFRADRPWWLSEHATRVLVLDDPELEALCGARAAALLDAGWDASCQPAAAGGPELPNGLRYDDRLRRLHAEALDAGEDFGDVMGAQGAEAFERWLREPAPMGALDGITRYALDVWRQRPDVQEAYPDLDGADAEGFAGWLWVHGRPELRLEPLLLPPAPAWVEQVERRLPTVAVTGYLRGNLGLGQAARGYVAALQAADVPVSTRTVATDPPVDRAIRAARRRPDEREFADLPPLDGGTADVHLLCVNADQLPGLYAESGEGTLRSSYVIGQWAWETDVIPERWDTAFDLVDEVWVYTSYVAEHVARAADVPVVVVPLPVEPPDAAGARLPIELPDAFTFLFAFDYFSTLERKNPLGVVAAFRAAFAPGEGPALVLKTINADFRPEAREALRHAVAGRPDIVLVDASFSPQEMAALLHRAGCFVSLHRSEGFGLGPAEAMALGKPVIATGFGGTTDFMTPGNSYVVDWRPRPVGPDAEHYPAEGMWAEPSVEHAAALMRNVWQHGEEARARGARAARDVAASLSPAAVGSIARARLLRIATRRLGGAQEDRPWPLSEVEGRLGFALDGGAGGGARGAARRAALRAMRPYTRAERSLDQAVAGSLRRLHLELEATRAARERDRDRIARLERRLAELAARREG